MTEAGIAPAAGFPEPSVESRANVRARATAVLVWGILITLLVVPLTYGNAIGNIAILLGLLTLFVADRGAYRVVFGLPHIRMLAASFGLLAIATLVVAGTSPDALVLFDFTPFLLAIPVSAVFLRAKIPDAQFQLSWLALVGTLVACGVAVFQYVVLHNTRPGGWELSPIHFADIAVTLGFMSGAGLLNRASRAWPLFALGPFLGVGAGLLSGTRSSLLVAVALLLLWLVCFIRRATWRRALIPVLGAVVVVGGTAAAVPGVATRVIDVGDLLRQIASAQPVDGPQFGFRLDQYEGAVRAFADSPVFGHGWRHQVQSALPYMSPSAQRDYAVEHWGYIHDEFLNMAVGMGGFGVIAWLLLMGYPPAAVFWARRHGRLSAEAVYLVLAPWLGILVGGLTDVLFNTELTKTFYCFIPTAILMLTWRRELPVPARSGAAA
jgi:O-antigen ligase